jgi:hypothetical protein
MSQTPPLQAGASLGTAATGGFTDLINLLLTSVGTRPDPKAAGNVALTQNSSQLPSITGAPLLTVPSTVTPDQIASALIRFMTGNRGVDTGADAGIGKGMAKGAVSKAIKGLPDPKGHLLESATIPLPDSSLPGGLNPAAAVGLPTLQDVTNGPSAQVPQDMASTVGGQGRPQSGTGSDVKAAGGGASSGSSLKTTETAINSKALVAFQMQLTPVSGQSVPDTQTPVKAEAVAEQASTPVIQPVTLADLQPAVNMGLVPAQQTNPTSQQARLAPIGPTQPIGAAQGPDKVTLPAQPKSDVGENPENTGGQGKPRQEQPEKSLAAAASGTVQDDRSSQGAAFQTGWQAGIPAQTGPALLNPSGPKNQASSTPLVASDTSDTKDIGARPQQQSGQTQQIEVRISQPQSAPVDLQVVQRAGQIQVVVRTPDAGMEASLRQDLNTLVHSLERSGFHTETFLPIAAAAGADGSRMNAQRDAQQGQSDSPRDRSSGQGGGQNGGQKGSGGNSRGDASRDQQESEAWTNSWEEQA